MNRITSTTARALDRLHPDHVGRTPDAGTDAARLTGAGLALIAAMRVAPDGLVVDGVDVVPCTGELTLTVRDGDHAAELAARLRLRTTIRIIEVDYGVIQYRWAGTWSGWPVIVRHAALPTRAPRAIADGGAR